MESPGKAARISGWIITTFIVLFMLVDGVGHTMRFAPYVKGTVDVGYKENVVMPLGIVAYYGGATATHVRAGQPFFFPIIFGILTWLGLWLREARLRELTPLRQ